MSLSTQFTDKGQKTRAEHINSFDGINTLAVTYHTFLQTLSAAKVDGGYISTPHEITTVTTVGAYNVNSIYALCEFIHPTTGLFRFALRTPKDTSVVYDPNISRYKLTATAVTTLQTALETAMGLGAGDLVYKSGIVYIRPRKQKP